MDISIRDPQYAISLAVSAAVAAGVFFGLFLFVLWAGWKGAAGLLSVIGIFLVWFYRGRRLDLETGRDHRNGGGDAGMG